MVVIKTNLCVYTIGKLQKTLKVIVFVYMKKKKRIKPVYFFVYCTLTCVSQSRAYININIKEKRKMQVVLVDLFATNNQINYTNIQVYTNDKNKDEDELTN